jgi:adenylate cyclase class 2
MPDPIEREIKLKVDDVSQARALLLQAGYRESQAREFEANILFDTPDQELRRHSMLLRLRQFGETGFVTWKGPPVPGPHKQRPELETSVGSIKILGEILPHLGYRPTFRYEKFRTEFTDGRYLGIVVLDETPIGAFLELEGDGGWIDETASRLGRSPREYILDSYVALYMKECQKLGMEPGQMVFSSSSECDGRTAISSQSI